MSKEIPLTQGYVAIVDDEDWPKLSKHKWHVVLLRTGSYAARRTRKSEGGNGSLVYMHRQLLGIVGSAQVDHADHDGLNNRRTNIRTCTKAQNMANLRKTRRTSRFKGVSWYKQDQKWSAQVTVDGTKLHLGYFDDEVLAARVYNGAAAEAFGEFALLNIIE